MPPSPPPGVTAELSDDVRRSIWEKYVFLVGLSATTTTMRKDARPDPLESADPRFLHDVIREVVAVGRAHGVALPEDYADNRMAFGDTLPADMTSSMHHDLEKGNRLEVEWLSGGVVRLGKERRADAVQPGGMRHSRVARWRLS